MKGNDTKVGICAFPDAFISYVGMQSSESRASFPERVSPPRGEERQQCFSEKMVKPIALEGG